ncbi:MAG: pyridoxamine 5'-phosphate oxidase family protein [Actinobacteria bacterium]|nr:pyridoxamine 5'-phosphate oxidase family protein [Actinomycetota bacterium]
MNPNDISAPSRRRPRASNAADSTVPGLPTWPPRTVAVLSSVDEDVHAIPVSAPVRAGDRTILLSLHRKRETLGRIRCWPEVALTFLAEGDVAFTARGRATVVEEPMSIDPYIAVSIAVDHVDDHRQPAFQVTAGVGREWVDEPARTALAARVRALSNAPVQQSSTPVRSAP